MEYAKDEIFNITYNSTKDKLEDNHDMEKNKKTQIYKFRNTIIFYIFNI